MGDIVYPIHMYKDLNRPKYAHDRKAVEALQLEGWTDIRANIPVQEYPRVLFNEAGNTVTVGDYSKDGVVDIDKAHEEESKFTALGYDREPVAKVVEPEVKPLAFSEVTTVTAKQGTRIDILDHAVANVGSDIENLKTDVSELKSGIAQIIDTLTATKSVDRSAKRDTPPKSEI